MQGKSIHYAPPKVLLLIMEGWLRSDSNGYDLLQFHVILPNDEAGIPKIIAADKAIWAVTICAFIRWLRFTSETASKLLNFTASVESTKNMTAT